MSRYSTNSAAPGMSSGRSRGSSLGQGGFSYTSETTTVQTTTTNTIHHHSGRTSNPNDYTRSRGVATCSQGIVNCRSRHLTAIDEDDYDSDSSDDTIVGRVSNMRLLGRTDSESTARGPRVIEISDSRSRISARPSGPSHYSTSRPADSHRRSTLTSSRPSESHYSSSTRPTDSRRRSTQVSTRPSESRYSTSSRPTDSYQPSSRTSHRPSESRYSTSRPADSHRRSTITSSRPSESQTYGAGKEVTVYGKGPTDNTKPSKALSVIKSLVKHI